MVSRSFRLGAVALSTILLAPWSQTGAAERPGLELELAVEGVSAYVFRGMVLNPDPALQPALTACFGDLAFSGWASVNLTDELGPVGEIGELDLVLTYGVELGPVTGSVGLGHYRYWTPEEGHTTELLVDLGLDGTVEPRLLLAYDVDAADGLYARLAVGLPIALGRSLDLDLEAGLAWGSAGVNAYNFDVDRSALADATVSATLEGQMGRISWWTRMGYSWICEGDIETAAHDIYGHADLLSGVVGLSWPLTGPRD